MVLSSSTHASVMPSDLPAQPEQTTHNSISTDELAALSSRADRIEKQLEKLLLAKGIPPPHMTAPAFNRSIPLVAVSPYHQQYHVGYTQRQYQPFTSEGEIRTDYAIRDHPANPHPVLQQTSTVAVYIQECEDLSIRNRDLSADNLLNLFMAGLKEEIHTEVILFRPQTLAAAMRIARVAEQKLITTKGGIPLPSADFDYYQHWSPYAPSAFDRYTYQYTPLGFHTSATTQPPSMATPNRNHHPNTGNYYQKPSPDEKVMLSNKVIDTVFWNNGDLKVVDEVTETKREEEEGEKESGDLEETVRREEEPTTVVLVETVVDEDGAKTVAQPPTVTASQRRASTADWTLNYRSIPKLLGFHFVNQSEMATATTDAVHQPPSGVDSNAEKGDKNHLGKRSIDLCRKRLVFEFDPIFGGMEFHGLTRRHLQALCKLNKIPANMTNVAMVDALSARLTPNAIAAINGGDVNSRPLLQVIDIKLTGNAQERYRLLLSNSRYYEVSDSVSTQHAMLATQLNDRVKSGQVVRGSVVQLSDYRCSPVQNCKIIVLLNTGTIMPECDIIGDPNFFLECEAISQKVLPNQIGEQSVRVTGTRINVQKSGVNKQSFHPVVQPPHQPPPNYKSRGPLFINEAPARIIPISALNPHQVRWAIKARVTTKGDLRRYNNAKGDRKVFSFDLLDSDGGEIRVPCFNTVVDRFYDVIEVGKVYVIWKGSLKRAQKNFNHLKNEWEIILDTTSTVDLCPDEEESIPRQQFTFAPITEIESAENNAIIDIIGIIVTVNTSVPILRKNGMETQNRTINLKDTSGKAVELTFWGDFCNREGQQLQEMLDSGSSPVLAVKAGKVSDFSGKSVGIISASQCFLNPDFPEVHALRQWVDQGGKNSASLSISKDGTTGGSRNDTRKAISNIKLVLKPEQFDEMVQKCKEVGAVVGTSDLVLFPSGVNICGINIVSRSGLSNAGAAMAGMGVGRINNLKDPSTDARKPTVGITMFGVTAPCANAVKQRLVEEGYETLVFHAAGVGGKAMEDLVRSGNIQGVLDIMTTEVTDYIVEGVMASDSSRFDAIIEKGIPLVMSVGALDMVNFGPKEDLTKSSPIEEKSSQKNTIAYSLNSLPDASSETLKGTRTIIQQLKEQISRGNPIIGAGAGTGISAKFEEVGGVDLIVLYNSGRCRMAGRGSLAGLLPFADADKHPGVEQYAKHLWAGLWGKAAMQTARDGVRQEFQTKYPELNLEVEVVLDGESIDTNRDEERQSKRRTRSRLSQQGPRGRGSNHLITPSTTTISYAMPQACS